MQSRVLRSDGVGGAAIDVSLSTQPPDSGWIWIDIVADDNDLDEVLALTTGLEFDALAAQDAVADVDLPKVDDFGNHLLVILHGLRDDRVATYEVDCFVTDRCLVTVHSAPSPALDVLWDRILQSPQLACGGVDELLARIGDVLTRRLLSVVDAFDELVDTLVVRALEADGQLVSEVTTIRSDLSEVRRVVHPQRETLDLLRASVSPLVSDGGRRRFSDVFDVALRASQGLDSARSALAEILDAYRGAEARKATDVTMVLTIYAAIMLPLSLVAGFFGMNFENLPGAGADWGWWMAAIIMIAIAVLSLGVFVAVGWIRRPSGRQAGAALGRGLMEASRAPAQVAGALYEISTMPLRATVRTSKNPEEDRR